MSDDAGSEKATGRPLAGESAHLPVTKKAKNWAATLRGQLEVTETALVEPENVSTTLGMNVESCCSKRIALTVRKLAERRAAAPS